MRRLLTVALLTALVVPARAAELSVLIKIGLRDGAATRWQGKVAVAGGELTAVEGWMFRSDDSVDLDGTFALTTDNRAGGQEPGTLPNGLLVRLSGPGTPRLTLTANALTWDIDPASLRWGEPVTHPSGALSAQLAPTVDTLSTSEREDDYPAACTLRDGTVIAVWQSYANNEDRLLWASYKAGTWSAPQEVPDLTGDLYRPVCSPDGAAGFWVICPKQLQGDFDLWATHFDGNAWSGPQNITATPGNDFDPAVCTDGTGAVQLVWQAYREGSSDILLATCRGGVWSAPTPVADSPGNEWMPAIAPTPEGAWIAWDSYQNGSYDVYAARLENGRVGTPLPIAASAAFEAKASVAVDKLGRVWVAWQEAGENWGKDTGATVPQTMKREAIYRQRAVKVACISNNRLAMAPDVSAAMPLGERQFIEEPRLCCDADGRLWLAVRHPCRVKNLRGNKIWNEAAWEDYLTCLQGDAWAPALYFPAKMARIDTFPALTPAPGGMAVVFHTDGRNIDSMRAMTRNRVFAAVVPAPGPVQEPVLSEAQFPEPQVVGGEEAQDVQRARNVVVQVANQAYHLLRGDLHRHTEISWDGNGDGSVLDCYRYAIDAANLDFLMVSDHNQTSGVDLEYIRWRSYKVADVYNHPPAFCTLYGYERSLGFPNGHRNIINTQRFHPSFPFTRNPAGSGVAPDDLKQLYEYCRREGAVVVPHTTGMSHGTNWPAYDPSLEPVVEIFQGCRNSYEYEGCPKGLVPGTPAAKEAGMQPEGHVWRAWQRRLDIGIICSSDHGSTHYSYAGIWATDRTREAVYEGIRARRSFGANDNIILTLRCGDHFMGESWKQDTAPILEMEVQGTAPITQIDLIRDFKFAYTVKPGDRNFKAQWMDNDFTTGTHLYYIRAQQADESIAWGSPVWITRG